MRSFYLAAAAAIALAAAPAQAVTLLFDDFDNEPSSETNATILNYNAFANFTVSDGTVDLLYDPNQFSLNCFGGAGSSCVDLDGTTGNGGTLTTRNEFAVAAGNLITLSFQLRGSQRNDVSNQFNAGFLFASDNPPPDNIDTVFNGNIASNAGFTLYSYSFVAPTAGRIRAFIGTPSVDNIGPILDNFQLTSVPEPATWAMMITGFGLVGAAMRRRKPASLITA